VRFLHGAITLKWPNLIVIEASRSHLDTPHSVGLLRTSDIYIHAPGGIQTRNPKKRVAADPRL